MGELRESAVVARYVGYKKRNWGLGFFLKKKKLGFYLKSKKKLGFLKKEIRFLKITWRFKNVKKFKKWLPSTFS